MTCEIVFGECEKYLGESRHKIDLTFLDPPFNQKKDYRNHNDNMDGSHYWQWMERICGLLYQRSSSGGAIYFMQREKNAHHVINTLLKTGWFFQNLIVWKKKTSAVPESYRYGKHYQIIVFATKGDKPRVFNKLRIDPPLLVTEKKHRPNGMFVTDVWDDIRELTSGYYAGDEPIRHKNGERVHNQQSPMALLLRIILSSTNVGDLIMDPFAGTGTTLMVASQLKRDCVGIEIDPVNVDLMKRRFLTVRDSDQLLRFHKDYIYTQNLNQIWQTESSLTYNILAQKGMQYTLYEVKSGSGYSIENTEG